MPFKYPPCVSPIGAFSASWSDKGASHTSCRLHPSVNSSRVSATERLVHSRFCGKSTSPTEAHACSSSACPSVGDVIGALLTSRDERGRLRCSAESTVLNLVFIGDSISFRSFNAAACSLIASGNVEITPPQYMGSHTKTEIYGRIHKHAKFRALRQHLVQTHSEMAAATSLTSVSARNFNVSGARMRVRLVGLKREGGSRKGPGILGDPAMDPVLESVFSDLLHHIGSCTAVLYNEGLHHHNALWSNASEHRSSVRHALGVLRRAANRSSVHVTARESSAQHFDTVVSAKRFHSLLPRGYDWPEGAPWAGLYEAVANISEARCDDTPHRKLVDWHSQTLREEVERLVQPAIPLLRWHHHTAIWHALFPRASSIVDCVHTACYTPYYWIALWEEWAAAIRGPPASVQAQSATFGARLCRNRTISHFGGGGGGGPSGGGGSGGGGGHPRRSPTHSVRKPTSLPSRYESVDGRLRM